MKFPERAGIGLLVGAVAGTLLGFAATNQPEPETFKESFESTVDFGTSILVGSTVGLVLGGMIGSASGKYKIYDLAEMSHEQKVETIEKLLKQRRSKTT